MRIGVDYDGTWTADPGLWRRFRDQAVLRGHDVVIVTGRTSAHVIDAAERLRNLVPEGMEIFFTSGEPKARYMRRTARRPVDVWVDNEPGTIEDPSKLADSPDATL